MPRKYAGPLQPGKRSAYVKGTRRNKKIVKAVKKRTTTNVVFNRGPSLIPDVYITKLKFNTEVDMNNDGISQAPSLRIYRMSGNSVYDADDTSLVNGYPPGYDEMRRFYQRFYVSLSSIRVNFICLNGSVSTGYRAIILPSTRNTTAGIDMNSLVANPYATKAQYFGPAFGKNIITRTHLMATKSITGRKDAVSEDDYHGRFSSSLVNGDPERQWFYHICVESVNDSFSPNQGIVVANIEMTYSCKFYDRRQQVQDPVDGLTGLDTDPVPPGNNPGNGPP